MPYKDVQKQKEAQRRYYEQSKDKLAKVRTTRRSYYRRVIDAAKNVPCADCQQLYPSYIMDFDHVRGEKRFNISRDLNGKCSSLRVLLEEIAKCEVVCANCHRHRTWLRKVKD